MKRLGIGLTVIVFFYYFFNNIPTDLEPPRGRPHHELPVLGGLGDARSQKPPGLAPEEHGTAGEGDHFFNGAIKFYKLASSLNKITNAQGSSSKNNNVLFASSSLKSAAVLIPIACEMALIDRNKVHFALLGRDEIQMDILRSVNGYTECSVTFHDARPDFSTTSTDYRMEVSSSAGLQHIDNYMHPQAVIIDASGEEDDFFLRAFREKSNALKTTLIELPKNAEQDLMWLTRLDHASLQAWNSVNIDILVHAQPAASGSLLRLLDSLTGAHFFNSAPPRLTIELPNKVEEPTKRYLESFTWPPKNKHGGGPHVNHLTLRHRIPQQELTVEENDIRFLESFWPANPANSHVLVLSPQVELSPNFYHYLKYMVLEYKYSVSGRKEYNFFGISLNLPSTYLNDTQAFTAPDGHKTSPSDGKEVLVPFLWQAPNSNAELYFGDKWTELHSFMSESLRAQHVLPARTDRSKVVSKTYPSWLEAVLELARARGYWTLYPNLPYDSLATVHTELYRAPEEFSDEAEMGAPQSDLDDPAKILEADPARHSSLSHEEKSLVTTSLLNMLPNNGIMPSPADMPILAWDGRATNGVGMWEDAVIFTKNFRREKGRCEEPGSNDKPRVSLSAQDLFCLDKGEGDAEAPPAVEPGAISTAIPAISAAAFVKEPLA